MKEIRLAVVGFGRGGGLFNLAMKGFEGIVPVAGLRYGVGKTGGHRALS